MLNFGVPWNSTSQYLVFSKFGPDTDFGLPSYNQFSFYDTSSDSLLPTSLQGHILTYPFWRDTQTLVVEKQLVHLQDENATITPYTLVLPSGYEAFTNASATWSDSQYGDEPKFGSATKLALSPDQGTLAYIRPSTLDDSPGNVVFTISRNAKSIAEARQYEDVGFGVESSTPNLVWFNNRLVYSPETGLVVDAQTQKVVLSRRTNYERRVSMLSPDAKYVLVVDNEQDRVEQNDYLHEHMRFYVRNIATGKDVVIRELSSAKASDVVVHATWAPDSQHFVYSFSNGLFLSDVNGGTSSDLTNSVQQYGTLAWSPNGAWLAVQIGEDIWLYSIAPKEITAGWKKYNSRTSSYKIFNDLRPSFTVKYDANWQIDEELGGLYLSENGAANLEPQISISFNGAALTGNIVQACKEKNGWSSPSVKIPAFVKFDSERTINIYGEKGVMVSYHTESDNNQVFSRTIVCANYSGKSLVVWATPTDSTFVKVNLIPVLESITFTQ